VHHWVFLQPLRLPSPHRLHAGGEARRRRTRSGRAAAASLTGGGDETGTPPQGGSGGDRGRCVAGVSGGGAAVGSATAATAAAAATGHAPYATGCRRRRPSRQRPPHVSGRSRRLCGCSPPSAVLPATPRPAARGGKRREGWGVAGACRQCECRRLGRRPSRRRVGVATPRPADPPVAVIAADVGRAPPPLLLLPPSPPPPPPCRHGDDEATPPCVTGR